MGLLLEFAVAGFAFMTATLTVSSNSLKGRLPIVRFASTSASFNVKRRKDSTPHPSANDSELDPDTKQLALRALIGTRCPSLFKEFRPLWWLPNGHLQTMYCVFGDFTKTDVMLYQRRYIRLLDGGTLGLDFAPFDADSTNLGDDVPIVVVKHGLTGGSFEPYVRAILHRAIKPVEKGGLGYRAVVVNFRGCAGVPVTTPQLYSAGHTDDLRQALMYISHRYPKAPLLGVGFSLGANVMTRYLAEEGPASRLAAGCVLGCPWDLVKNNTGLNSNFVGKHVYSKALGTNLVRLLKRHADTLAANPDHPVAKAVPLALSLKKPTIEKFDDTLTRIAGGSAPNFPFKSAQDYYTWASSHKVLQDIRVPFLAINAADDPVVYHAPEDGAGNEYVIMILTSGGGHLGWFQTGEVSGSIDRWTTKPVLEWLKVMAEEVVHDTGRQPVDLYLDHEGFVREKGRDGLGCKETEGGAIIKGVRKGRRGHGEVLQGL